MPTRSLRITTTPACRPYRHSLREICQTLLWKMRGPLLAEVISTWLYRWRVLWHDIPSPTILGLSDLDPSQGRGEHTRGSG